MHHMFLGLSRHDLESEDHCFPRETSFGATMLWLMRMSMAGSLLLERILRLVQLLLLKSPHVCKRSSHSQPSIRIFSSLTRLVQSTVGVKIFVGTSDKGFPISAYQSGGLAPDVGGVSL